MGLAQMAALLSASTDPLLVDMQICLKSEACCELMWQLKGKALVGLQG
jgi:hypothetical protein